MGMPNWVFVVTARCDVPGCGNSLVTNSKSKRTFAAWLREQGWHLLAQGVGVFVVCDAHPWAGNNTIRPSDYLQWASKHNAAPTTLPTS